MADLKDNQDDLHRETKEEQLLKQQQQMRAEMQKDLEAKRLLIQMRMLKHGDIKPEDVIKPEVSLTPETFKEKRLNFWYHYKWATLALVLAVALIIVFIVSMVNKVEYDTTFTAISVLPLSMAQSTFERVLSPLTVDANGDKKQMACFVDVPLENTKEQQFQDPNALLSAKTKLAAMLSDKEAFIFLLDEQGYDFICATGIKWLDLETIAQSENIDGNKYMLKGSALAKELDGEEILEDSFICVMDFEQSAAAPKTKKAHVKRYEAAKQLMKNIIEMPI
ncbi:MAG: hypothetical protein RR497_05940 [Oscillospiraceae bacterium]